MVDHRISRKSLGLILGSVLFIAMAPLLRPNQPDTRMFVLNETIGYALAVGAIVSAGFYLLTDLRILQFAGKILKRTPHFSLYLIFLALGQLLLTLGGDVVTPEGLAKTLSFLVIGFLGFIVFPAALYVAGSLGAFWATLSTMGSVASAVAVLGVLGFNPFAKMVFLHLPLPFFDWRSTGSVFFEPNVFGVVGFLGAIGSLFFLKKKGRYLILALLALGLNLAGIFLSWGRAIWIATVVALGLYLFLGRPVWQRWLMLAATGAAVVVIVFGLYYWSSYLSSIPLIYNLLELQVGLAGRSELWAAAREAIAQRPWLGYGISNLAEVVHAAGWPYLYTFHNAVLDFIVMTGIPASFLYFWVLLESLVRLVRSSPLFGQRRLWLSALVGVTLIIQFSPHNVGGANLIALTIAILFGLANASPLTKEDFPLA